MPEMQLQQEKTIIYFLRTAYTELRYRRCCHVWKFNPQRALWGFPYRWEKRSYRKRGTEPPASWRKQHFKKSQRTNRLGQDTKSDKWPDDFHSFSGSIHFHATAGIQRYRYYSSGYCFEHHRRGHTGRESQKSFGSAEKNDSAVSCCKAWRDLSKDSGR